MWRKAKLRSGIRLNWKILVAILAFSALAVTLFDLLGSGDRDVLSRSEVLSDTIELEIAPVKGSIAPNFILKNLDGEEVQLSDFRGRPVLINLWATWCGPCRLEMPAIQDRFELYGENGFRDDQTGSLWNIIGEAIDGPLAGQRLEPIVAGEHFWFAWAAFKPDTIVWSPVD